MMCREMDIMGMVIIIDVEEVEVMGVVVGGVLG